jgi:hypothetical protein
LAQCATPAAVAEVQLYCCQHYYQLQQHLPADLLLLLLVGQHVAKVVQD